MKTLDRYIVGNFVFNAILCFIVMISLRVLADLFFNMDEFTEGGEGFLAAMGNIGGYYGYQMLVYFSQLGGVIIVSAAAFTLAVMNHTNELTAILASGVSLRRVILPIMICAVLMGALIILDRELLIPPVAHKLVRSRDDVRGTQEFAVRLETDVSGAIWYSGRFDPAKQHMQRPVISIRDNIGQLVACITGESAVPSDRLVAGQAGWEIRRATLVANKAVHPWPNTPTVQQVYTRIGPTRILRQAKAAAVAMGRTVSPDRRIREVWQLPPIRDKQYGMRIEAERLYLAAGAGPDADARAGTLIRPKFIFTTAAGKSLGIFMAESATWQWQPGLPDENHWKLAGGVLFFPTDITVEALALRQSSRWMDYMSTPQLTRLLELGQVSSPASAVLAKHIRLAEPINNLLMLLLGLPFILSREGNIKASASLCVLVVGVFFAFIYICRYMELDPMLSAWLPTLIFGPVGVVMLDSVKT